MGTSRAWRRLVGTYSLLSRSSVALAVILTFLTPFAPPVAAQTGIAFVQGNYSCPQQPTATVAVAYNNAQTAGNLNVIAIGWSDTVAAVTSVTDSAGNTYAPANTPTVRAGQITQVIYYAKN